jgi:hypothetical protein
MQKTKKRINITVKSCYECPHIYYAGEYEDYQGSYCDIGNYLNDEVETLKEIPEWCPLEDVVLSEKNKMGKKDQKKKIWKKEEKKEIKDALCKLSKQDRFGFKIDPDSDEVIGYSGNSVIQFITVAVKMLGMEHYTSVIKFISNIEKNLDKCKK